MGQPEDMRHIVMKNGKLWSRACGRIHMGAGTSQLLFYLDMGARDIDYTDMNVLDPASLNRVGSM